MTLDQLFGGHREQVAEDQTGDVEEHLADRHRVHFQRETARRPDAALDRFRQLPEIVVPRVGFRPGVDDSDNRLVKILIGVTHRFDQGTPQQNLSGFAG